MVRTVRNTIWAMVDGLISLLYLPLIYQEAVSMFYSGYTVLVYVKVPDSVGHLHVVKTGGKISLGKS